MGLLTNIKTRLAYMAATNLAEKCAKGDMGPLAQKVYLKTKGKKTAIGTVLVVLTMAVAQFSPPWADEWVRYSGIAAGALTAIGWLDKARRSEPVFEPWMLEALATASAWIASVSTVVLAAAQGGTLNLFFPGDLNLVDQVTLYTTAITTATAFLNRIAKASAELPKPLPNPATEGPKP